MSSPIRPPIRSPIITRDPAGPPSHISIPTRRLQALIPPDAWVGRGAPPDAILLPCDEIFAGPVPRISLMRLAELMPGWIRATQDCLIPLPAADLALSYDPRGNAIRPPTPARPSVAPPSWKSVPKLVRAPGTQAAQRIVPSVGTATFPDGPLPRSEALAAMIMTGDPVTAMRVVNWFASFYGVRAVVLIHAGGACLQSGTLPAGIDRESFARQSVAIWNQSETASEIEKLVQPVRIQVQGAYGALSLLRAGSLTAAVVHDDSDRFTNAAASRMREGMLALDGCLSDPP